MERLRYERDIALRFSLEAGTRSAYDSHLRSYLAFCRRHNLPYEPTPDTLSLYVVYESHHINPRSVKSYLSGICNSLETLFPGVRAARNSPIVCNTLAGRLKMGQHSISRKRPLSRADVGRAIAQCSSGSHDDLLFGALLGSGFNALHRLGERVWPDTEGLQDFRKCIPFGSLEQYVTLPLGS